MKNQRQWPNQINLQHGIAQERQNEAWAAISIMIMAPIFCPIPIAPKFKNVEMVLDDKGPNRSQRSSETVRVTMARPYA